LFKFVQQEHQTIAIYRKMMEQ